MDRRALRRGQVRFGLVPEHGQFLTAIRSWLGRHANTFSSEQMALSANKSLGMPKSRVCWKSTMFCSAQLYPPCLLQRSLAMLKQFEELPENVQALMLAKLAIVMKAAKAHSLYHLAKIQRSEVSDLWRNICRKAAQPLCTIPIEVLKKPNPDELGYKQWLIQRIDYG
jgi:hypothetical protein